MAANFEIKNAANGRFIFNLKAANGEIILTSGVFATKEAASTAVGEVKANAPNVAQFERKTASNKQPYFVLKAANGEILGRSETYSSTSAMEHGIKSVMRNAVEAAVKDLTAAEVEVAHR